MKIAFYPLVRGPEPSPGWGYLVRREPVQFCAEGDSPENPVQGVVFMVQEVDRGNCCKGDPRAPGKLDKPSLGSIGIQGDIEILCV
jgi:hypothetical protein